MSETKLTIPKFIVPLSWVILIIATIKDLDVFYGYSGLKSVLLLVIGLFAIMIFATLSIRQKGTSKERLRTRRLYLFGVIASFLLLFVPGAFETFYPRLIEPSKVEQVLDVYLKTNKRLDALITNPRSEIISILIKADRSIQEGNIELANSLLVDADKLIDEHDDFFTAFSKFIHSKIESEKAKFDKSISYIDEGLLQCKNNKSQFFRRLIALLLNSKSVVLSRQHEGVDVGNFFSIYDSSIEEANAIGDFEMIAKFQLSKAIAYQRYAVAIKSSEAWARWEEQSIKTLQDFQKIDSRAEIDAVMNYLNGIRARYSQLLDSKNQILLSSLLLKHDSILSIGEKIIAVKPVELESKKRWIVNAILFDFFTREPAKTVDYDSVLRRIDGIVPNSDSDSYQYTAQWHQIRGLLERQTGHDNEAIKQLLIALNIWQENKQIAKERELINDLIDCYSAAKNNNKVILTELYFRWAGLRLLQKKFDPEISQRPLLLDVISRLSSQKIVDEGELKKVLNIKNN
jgi:hypothetical protein